MLPHRLKQRHWSDFIPHILFEGVCESGSVTTQQHLMPRPSAVSLIPIANHLGFPFLQCKLLWVQVSSLWMALQKLVVRGPMQTWQHSGNPYFWDLFSVPRNPIYSTSFHESKVYDFWFGNRIRSKACHSPWKTNFLVFISWAFRWPQYLL